MPTPAMPADGLDSAASWRRLVVSVLLTTIGGVGMWSVVVVLPAVQAEFGAARGAAALPYTLTMIGFAFGGVLMGKLADRFGILTPLVLGGACLFLGYGATALSTSLCTRSAIVRALSLHTPARPLPVSPSASVDPLVSVDRPASCSK